MVGAFGKIHEMLVPIGVLDKLIGTLWGLDGFTSGFLTIGVFRNSVLGVSLNGHGVLGLGHWDCCDSNCSAGLEVI